MANSANTATSRIISFHYDFDGDHPKTLTYQGDAHFPSHSTSLRLTKTDSSGKPQTYSAGRVVHNTPVPFWGAEALVELETTIKFIISTVDNDPGDGLVFFIAPVGTTIPSGSYGETFGVFDSATDKNPSVFAVEFDTHVNPDVDPNHRHIGINIEYLKSSKTTKVDDANFGQEVTAQINYVEATKEIRVEVTAGSNRYEVSYVYDLKTVLEQQVQVGLAASTGGNVAIHDVVSWYFKAKVVKAQIISFNYDFYGDQPKTLTYQGDAHFPSDTTFLRLTKTDYSGKPQTNSFGRVVHNTPVPFWEAGAQVDLETTIKFIITTVDNNPADGLVFFIAPVGTTIPSGSIGETFGVFDSATGKTPSVFAVEFDTFVNPNVDPNHRHIGINIEYLKSSETTEVDDAIFGQEVTARINYVEATKVISVVVTAGSKKYEVSNVYDLSTVLNQQVQVGLAASTGGNVAIHDVVSWYFTATVVRTTAN